MGSNDILFVVLGLAAILLINIHGFNNCRDGNGNAVSCASGSGAVAKAPGIFGLGIGPL